MAAPQGFPLLRLPHVSLWQVFVQMDPHEMYKLAKTSQKMFKVLKLSQWKLRYALVLCVDEGYFFSVRSVDDKELSRFTISAPTENGLNIVDSHYNIGQRENVPHIFSHRNIFTLYEDCLEGARDVYCMLSSFLKFQKTEYFVFKCAVPLTLNQTAGNIGRILNPPYNRIRDDLWEHVRNEIQYVVSNNYPEYQFQLGVNDTNVSKWLIFTGKSFNWREHLSRMNFRTLRVQECTLSNRNMNRFIRHISRGYYDRLELASFRSFKEWNIEEVLRDIQRDEENGPKTFIVEEYCAVYNGISYNFLINHANQRRGTVITYQFGQFYKLAIVVEKNDVQVPNSRSVPFDFVS